MNVSDFFMQTSTPMCVLSGPDFVVSAVNSSFKTLLPKAPLGEEFASLVSTGSLAGLLKTLHHVSVSGTSSVYRDAAISELIEAFMFYPLKNSSGVVSEILVLPWELNSEIHSPDETLGKLESFRNLVNLIPQMLFIASAKGEGLYHNQRWQEYSGLSDEEGLGDKWMKILHPEDKDRCVEAWRNSLANGKPFESEYRLRRKDGVYRWHLSRALPILDSQGHVTGWYGSITDIHEQKLLSNYLSKSTEEFRLITETIPGGIWRTNLDGSADYYNRRFAEMLGADDQELLGWGWAENIHEEDRPNVLAAWEKARATSSPVYLEFRYRHKDGSYRWYRSQGNPFFDEKGELTKYYGTWTDIDGIKKESEEFLAAKEAAESANKAKSEFLANMSHEIRTPLGVILGFADLLREAETETEKQNYYNIISRNGQALTNIINDILDLSKIEAGRLKIEKSLFSPKQLILDMLDVFQDQTKSRKVLLSTHFSEDFPQIIESDPSRFRQILINIIGNAAKFTEEGSIRIEARTERLSPHEFRLHVLVEDTGPGIDKSQQTQLFQPFTQLDSSTTRRHGGTGLGLALSRRLAQALGGDVTLLKSTPNEGSVFEITINFPASSASFQMSPTESTSNLQKSSKLSGLQVLVVEDHADNRFLLDKLLSHQGAKVEFAVNGQEGLDKALSNHHDVVLLDIQMPEMDGYEVMRRLNDRAFKTPVIALTAHAMEEDRRRSQELGFMEHLSKPLNTSELLKILQAIQENKSK